MTAPSPWLVANLDCVSEGARVLDVASGRGRHALALAARGCRVTAVDRDAEALAVLAADAARLGLTVETVARDLEGDPPADLGTALYDVVLVTHYLHRPLMPSLVRALAPGGVLIYETFTRAQAARGKPTNPAFLLEPGELPRLVAPLVVLRQREGDYDGRAVASVVAAWSTAR